MRFRRRRRLIQLFFFAVYLGLIGLTFWPLGSAVLAGFLHADPLVAVNSLRNLVVRPEMVAALVVLISPLFLGRAFCGYVCPMGFLVEITGPRSERRWGGRLQRFLRPVPSLVLAVVFVLVLFGSSLLLAFDPLVLLTRSAATLLFPAVDWIIRSAGDLLYRLPALRDGVDSLTAALTGRLVFTEPLGYRLQVLFAAIFVGILALSWVERRMWCRHLCPLGALLGLVGRSARFGRLVDEEACIECGKCRAACPMGAISAEVAMTDLSRCELGLECADACRAGAVSFGRRPRAARTHDPSRRQLLIAGGGAAVAGLALTVGLRPALAEARLRGAGVLRPPGAAPEPDFVSLCTRCGECLKVCPTNVLQPVLFGAGVEGLFTPEMDYSRAYCEWSCNECGKICPTRAIRPLPLDEKRKATIGVAQIDREHCLPWALGQECLVCQELCPVPEKAIALTEGQGGLAGGEPAGLRAQIGGAATGGGQAEGRGQAGGNGTDQASGTGQAARAASPVGLPVVLVDRCIGCGICQHNCPAPRTPAIEVRRAT